MSFLLSACTTNAIPEEEFEAPNINFPILNTVPDRPSFPDSRTLIQDQKRLQSEHDEATQKQAEVIKSQKS